MNLSDYIAVALISAAEKALQEGNAADVYVSLAQAKRDAREVLDSSFPGPQDDQIQAAMEQLLAAGLVEPFRTPHAAARYRFIWEMIADLGERVTRDDPAFSGALWAFRNLGLTWLRESYRVAVNDPAAAEILPPELVGSIPASDRYVTLSDNDRDDVTTQLQELRRQVQSDNEAPSDAREIALSEIAAFEATVFQPRVSTELIERFVQRVLTWIAKVFSHALVATVAEELIKALMKLN